MAHDSLSNADPELEQMHEQFKHASTEWQPIRDEGATDMRFVAGDVWDPTERALRVEAQRPVLSLDELGQYFNQVINDVRANPRAVRFSPTGHGANDDTAEFYQNKMREIEYRSNGQIHYTGAFENGVQRSYGYVRVNTEYSSFRSNDQEISIAGFPNPDMVLVDPSSRLPDSSDMRYCFVHETWPMRDFTRRFKGAKVQGFGAFDDFAGEHQEWIQDDTITLAEYWHFTERQDDVVRLSLPGGQFIDVLGSELQSTEGGGLLASLGLREMPEVLQQRRTMVPQVKMWLTNGYEKLEATDWIGAYIPIVSCYGKVIYVLDGGKTKRKILSMTRLARDPAMLYSYYRTCQAELVGQLPRVPVMGYEGQFVDSERWAKAAREPVAFLEVKATVEGAPPGLVLPLPQRHPYDPPIEKMELGAEGARRAIQAAMGVSPLPTSAQRRNEKSGVALRQIEESGQRGTYHFVDNFDYMIRRVGVITEDLMDRIYDTRRDVGVVLPDEKGSTIRINDPEMEPTAAQEKSISTKGEHQVTISTGPAFESQRIAAMEFADLLAVHPDPNVFRALGPMIVKLKNLGPIGDEFAKKLEMLQPPEMREKTDEGDGPPIPPQVRAQLAQAEQIITSLTERLQAMEAVIRTDQVKQDAQTARQREHDASDRDTKLAVALEKGRQALEQIQAKGDEDAERQDDAQRHEVGMGPRSPSIRAPGGRGVSLNDERRHHA